MIKQIEIKLKVDKDVITETLNRIGIADRKRKILYPSCILYEESNRFFILHFKEMFLKEKLSYNNISEEDIERRNSIIFCLKNWGLIDVIDSIDPHSIFVYVLSHKDKSSWKIIHKYFKK